MFSLEQIKHIYHLRWGQETSFRVLKHTIGTTNFHSKSPEYIEFEILSRMTLYNFCTIITMEIPIKKEAGKWDTERKNILDFYVGVLNIPVCHIIIAYSK